MQFILWHQFRGIELDMIDFLFEKVINLYFSGSDGLNLKTMEMAEGDHLEFRHSDLSKYKKISEMGSVWDVS